MIKDNLLQLNFSSSQADVYLAFVSLGQTKVGPIIEKTGFHRNIVYRALESFVKRGLAYKTSKRGVAYYTPVEPKKLFEEFSKKQSIAESVAAELQEVKPGLTEIKTLTDTQGIIDYLNLLLESKTDILVLGLDYHLQKKYPEIYQKFEKNLLEKKVKRQVLTYPEFKEDTHLLKNAETRFLPKEYIKSPVLINIFGDSVAQLLWLNPVVIIVVKNKEMAEGYRDYFKLLWNKSH